MPFWRDADIPQRFKHRPHCTVRVPKELAAPNTNEPPTETFKNGLPRHILRHLLDGMEAVAIAFDS
jgi:hypothetical protein